MLSFSLIIGIVGLIALNFFLYSAGLIPIAKKVTMLLVGIIGVICIYYATKGTILLLVGDLLNTIIEYWGITLTTILLVVSGFLIYNKYK